MDAQQDDAVVDRAALDQRLLFRNTMHVTPGHMAQYRRAVADAVVFARGHAPQVMVDVFIDDQAEQAISFQIYADSEAVPRHWQLSDPYIAEVMRHCTVVAFEVFGNPSDEVRAGLGATSGMSVKILPRLVGYLHGGSG
jgi:hypothetical protein